MEPGAVTVPAAPFQTVVPPPGFDPVRNMADRARLASLGLPPAPDPQAEPLLYAHWATFFAPGMQVAGAPPPPTVPPDCRLGRTRILALRRAGPRQASRLSVSGNWSGGWIAANRGERFRAVAARWRAPSVAAGAPEDAAAEPYRCSIWVGLDGKHRWADSMPQLGTEHTADGGQRFWHQWWIRDATDMQHYVTSLPLDPDDEVLCYLAMLSTTRVVYAFANISKMRVAFRTVSKPDDPMRGSTAEWVLERPANGQVIGTTVITGNLFPMPNFGLVTCDGFAASCVPLAGNAPPRAHDLVPCRTIQNGTVRRDATRTAITARAERYRRRDIAIRYQPPR